MIELTANNGQLLVNPDGAWVESLSDSSNSVFFPKSTIPDANGAEKTRGGMHVCLPNFGPGGESGLAQHGFGRTSTWSVLQQTESSVTLELNGGESGYDKLVSRLNYEIGETAMTATLWLTNNGDTPLRVAPGFHPYFALEPSEKVVVMNGIQYELDELAGTEYIAAESADIQTATRRISITIENLKTWAIWTDQLGQYVCVEPTFGGNRFLETEQPDEQLQSGETKQYSVTINY